MDVLHLFPFLLVFWTSPVLSAQDVVSIPAEPGQNINLTCRATKNSLVTVLRLTRDDLKQQKEVFVYRNGKINEKSLNPQFKGRTSLQSLSTADGEVNVTLSNVTKEDNGTYGCLAVTKEGRLETIIHLHVDPPGNNRKKHEEGENKDGSDGPTGGERIGLIAGLVAAVLTVAAVLIVAAVIVLKKKKKKKTPHNGIENGVQIPLTDQNTSSPS
ncbi:PREDICTED: butyrophilin subfamily 2 member A1-like [Cyprinodon variegatus]|uniref:butyrophilin subfamily 2 member A1-like n=1 Tax=Cyprinodon variegatus TaxID=28743 RepID=UPI0007427A36|nr:PREDICTED: butyrophilin subfamily 2 member A1-like [Cyprinodon variegatus]